MTLDYHLPASITAAALSALVVSMASLAVFAGEPRDDDRGLFFRLCRGDFESWDLNRDGRLSVGEIDRNLLDPAITGDEACALAALHGCQRRLRKRGQDGALTKSAFDTLERAHGGGQKDARACLSLFRKARLKLAHQSPLLFAPGAPHLTAMRQGKIGDCYLIATIGALTSADPQAVRRLIRENADGTFTVQFHGEGPVSVSRPSDGTLACYADAFADGIWLSVLERAYAQLKQSKDPEGDADDDDLYQDISGGRSGRVIKLLTGRKARRARFKKAEVRAGIRTTLESALKDKRLVVASIHNQAEDGRKAGNHAVAVIGFDAGQDAVELWNPWGTTRPYKAAGVIMKNGLFSMPVPDFLSRFRSVSIERR